RVPLIVRWPAGVKPATSDAVACSVDLLPTLAELCGISVGHNVDGVSLASLLKGSGAVQRDALYWHYPHYSNQLGRPGGAIRAGDWKLIEFYDNGRRELFNLKNSVNESQNLAIKEPKRVEELAKHLDNWRKSVGAQRMTPNPSYAPN